MRTQSRDTDINTEKVLISLIRNAKTSTKFDQIRSLSRTTLNLSRRAILRKNPGLNEQQINVLFISYLYGQDLANRFQKYLSRK
jgi:hypothetical protein